MKKCCQKFFDASMKIFAIDYPKSTLGYHKYRLYILSKAQPIGIGFSPLKKKDS